MTLSFEDFPSLFTPTSADNTNKQEVKISKWIDSWEEDVEDLDFIKVLAKEVCPLLDV